jgi:integrase
VAQTLTDAIVKALPVPEKGNKVYYDDDVRGFGCRVTAGGARAFVLNYRVRGSGRERRYTIGDANAKNWTTVAARKEAGRLRREIDAGGDPLADLEAEREAPTVSELIDRFITEHVTARLRPSSAKSYRILIEKHLRPFFGKHTKVSDVTYADIDALHRKITSTGSPYAANRSLAVMSKMFGLAVRWGMRDKNPVRGVQRNPEGRRRRYLDGAELGRLVVALAACPDQQVANIVRVALLTGARIGEIFAMRWADLSTTEERDKSGHVGRRWIWSKPAAATKQKAEHTIPLSAPAAQLLAEIRAQQTAKHKPLGEFVFPTVASKTGHFVNIEKSWGAICRAAGIEGLRLHDLRHSFASQLVSRGASLPLIGALLGHSNPSTTARYSHLFDDPLRAAVDSVGSLIEAAGMPPGANAGKIKPFPKGGPRGR